MQLYSNGIRAQQSCNQVLRLLLLVQTGCAVIRQPRIVRLEFYRHLLLRWAVFQGFALVHIAILMIYVSSFKHSFFFSDVKPFHTATADV